MKILQNFKNAVKQALNIPVVSVSVASSDVGKCTKCKFNINDRCTVGTSYAEQVLAVRASPLLEVQKLNNNKMSKNQTVTVEVEIDVKEGKRTIEMELKEPHEIEDCEEGKAVMLILCNGETYTGIFKGIDGGEDIMLGSLSGRSSIGLKVSWVDDYFEQVGS